MNSEPLVILSFISVCTMLFLVNGQLQARLNLYYDIIVQHVWCIDGINSWNVQIWNSVDLTNWEGKNILNTCAMQSFALLHVGSHLGPFAFTSLILWSVSLSLCVCWSVGLFEGNELTIFYLTGMCSGFIIRWSRIAISKCHRLQSDIN